VEALGREEVVGEEMVGEEVVAGNQVPGVVTRGAKRARVAVVAARRTGRVRR
jgi:hypothetical protein